MKGKKQVAEVQDYYLDEISEQNVDVPTRVSLMSRITDFVLLLAFMSFVVPELRISPSGPTYTWGYPRISELLGLLAGACAVCEAICSGWRLRFSALHGVLLAHLIVSYVFGEAILSTVRTGGKGVFRSGELIPIVMFIAISQLDFDSRRVKSLFIRFVVAQILVAFTIYAQKAGLIAGFATWASAGGTKRLYGFGYKVAQTTYGLVTAIVIILGMIWGKRRGTWIIVGCAALLFLISAMLLTLTRVAPFALALAIGFMLYGQRHWFSKGVMVGIITAILVGISVLFVKADLSRLLEFSLRESRVVFWKDAFLIGLNFPFGTGTGSYLDPSLNGGVVVGAHPQNDFFYAFATQGWLTAGLLVVMYLLLIKLVLSVRRLNTSDSQMWFRCFGGSFAVWFMFGMVEICFTTYLFNGPLFMLMAICFGYLNYQRSQDLIYYSQDQVYEAQF